MSTTGSINSITTSVAMTNSRNTVSLTADQKAGIQSVLKNFDSSKLTSSDAKKITAEFKKLGVKPGKELEAAMAATGFDAKQVGSLAFGGGHRPPPEGNGGGKSIEAVKNTLSELKTLLKASESSSSASNTAEDQQTDHLNQFVEELFSKYSESPRAGGMKGMPPGGPPPGGAHGDGPRPPPPQGGAYDEGGDMKSFLKTLMASVSSDEGEDSNSTSASATGSGASSSGTGFASVIQRASDLLESNGIPSTSVNLKSFMQILEKNVSAAFDGTGQLIDRIV